MTRRMALSDAATDSTRALPRTAYIPPTASRPAYSEPTRPAAGARREERRSAGRRRLGSFFALLLVLAAIAAVGVALIASSDRGSNVAPVDSDSAQQQIQDLRQFLQEHSR